jgi:UDP-N-acetyl-D-glucosamine dehydrogenase
MCRRRIECPYDRKMRATSPQGNGPLADALCAKFAAKQATVGVVGLGYVGLPLVRAMHATGFRVVGFDTDAAKIHALREGRAYLQHLGQDFVRELAASQRFKPTTDAAELGACDAICVCVPTPLGKHKDPDLSFVETSMRMIARVLRPGMVVSLESTTYPGTTRELCKPILEAAGGDATMIAGKDFFLVFSPEREDPGRAGVATHQIPRLVGGIDPESTRVGHALYAAAIDRVIAVDSAEVAEAAKLVENIYRSVNIALVNELKPVLTSMGIDIWKVLDAAATKPFGFQRFNPGPGLGGHCIPIDPYYLTWKAREFGHATKFIELAGEINSAMPHWVVERVAGALNDEGKAIRYSRVLVLGIAYKPDVDDIRETPAAEIISLLEDRGAIVAYHDPHVPKFPRMRRYAIELASQALTPELLAVQDCVLVVTDHRVIDWDSVATHARLVVDTRNALGRVADVQARVVLA